MRKYKTRATGVLCPRKECGARSRVLRTVRDKETGEITRERICARKHKFKTRETPT